LIVLQYLFCFRENVHAKIHLLLSLRYGVSPGAKEVGEVMRTSPPLFLAAPLLRGRDLSLPVVPFSFAYSSSHEVGFGGVTGCIRTSLPIPSGWGPISEGELSSVMWLSRVVESLGSVAEGVFVRTATRAMRG
jgi:hypothetical protein